MSEVLINPYRFVAVEIIWQEQSVSADVTYLWSKTASENWQYGVKNDTGSSQSLSTYSINLKKVGSPDIILEAVVWENDKTTLKQISSNTITGTDLTTSLAMTDFTFSPAVTVNSDEYFGFRAKNAGTDIETNYIAAQRDESIISTQFYNDYPDTGLGSNYFSLTWQAKG